ncbi:GNAT family N-acetyltransferase [Glycomyces xiaoerkulensis]|uniref:GNAT family N-acetyltransferase n=1 Tax=Glycomyces xiaoerkulensis TaxID=2038139 RepID=UPI000C26988A|nr:GNAT family N-acetyltransferase [Glycomyces xiaoerkulensis]
MSAIDIRPALPAELRDAAGLRWSWEHEHPPVPRIDRERYVEAFAEWAARHTESHRCLVAARDGQVVGMAWLAVASRPPTPRDFDRACGDLQSVYVLPDERGRGVGGRLVAAVLELARDLGLFRVTVQAGSESVPFYTRQGFAATAGLLIAEPSASDDG